MASSINENLASYCIVGLGVCFATGMVTCAIGMRNIRKANIKQREEYFKQREGYDTLITNTIKKADTNKNEVLETSEISDLLQEMGHPIFLPTGKNVTLGWTTESPKIKDVNTEKSIIYLNINDVKRYLGDNSAKKIN